MNGRGALLLLLGPLLCLGGLPGCAAPQPPTSDTHSVVTGAVDLSVRANQREPMNQPRALIKFRKLLAGGATWEAAVSDTALS